MSQPGKLTPNLDQNSTKVLNLTVLQRLDPSIEEILITSAHVTLYEFNIESNQWSRKDVEGSLFVVKRNTQPRFQFIVLNRRCADNLVENLLGDFEYEVHVPYLLYRNAAQEVNGIWFYNPRECEEVANLFSRILSAYSKVPSKPKSSTKSEFEELEGVSSISVMETLLEPSPNAPAINSPEDSTAFMNFFNMALNIGKHADPAKSMQHNHSAATVPLSPLVPSVASSPAPNPDMLNLSLSSSYYPIGRNDSSDLTSSSDRISRLIKPSSFLSAPSSSSALLMPPISPSNPTAASLRPPLNLQHPHGTPLFNPFPPPAPSASLTPSPTPQADRPFINRERVRDALVMLVQDDQFVDMFYQTLLKVHFK
ncbi:mRNA-decapping enzyme-like protein [Rhodamnia argentea]|uniref:mRNA-decapping enzyme-like protein n=1 Tax=Rhodamnia argentea TaxID=178133 RepID=A0A8B8QNI5_9MYRT|nr:mRNA-decapping enzyme-like protein [Rhodamnia argentea]